MASTAQCLTKHLAEGIHDGKFGNIEVERDSCAPVHDPLVLECRTCQDHGDHALVHSFHVGRLDYEKEWFCWSHRWDVSIFEFRQTVQNTGDVDHDRLGSGPCRC